MNTAIKSTTSTVPIAGVVDPQDIGVKTPGVSTEFSPDDHVHGAGTPVAPQPIADTAVIGSSKILSPVDHVHKGSIVSLDGYYWESDSPFYATHPYATSPGINLRLAVLGKMCVLWWEEHYGTISTDTYIQANTWLPSAYRPPEDTWGWTRCQRDGTTTNGAVRVATDGDVRFVGTESGSSSGFGAVGTSGGLFAGSISWVL